MSRISKIPAFVLQMLSKEAERDFICGSNSSSDISTVDLKLIQTVSPPIAVGPKDLVYEVARQRSDGSVIYLKEHMDRFVQSVETVFGLDAATAEKVRDDAMESLKRLQTANHPKTDLFFEQNIKYIAYQKESLGSSSRDTIPLDTLAFYIHSTYPPSEWYTTGATLGLLFGAHRDNPHAKVVYPELKSKAADQIKKLQVFESLIVHDNGLVPEGVRSNFLLVMQDGSLISSLDDDILVGTTLLAVRRQCEALGIPFHSRRVFLSDIVESEAAAMLGTSVNVLPISKIVLAHEDSCHQAVRDLLDKFKVGETESGLKTFYLRKNSGTNSTLKLLNDNYVKKTF